MCGGELPVDLTLRKRQRLEDGSHQSATRIEGAEQMWAQNITTKNKGCEDGKINESRQIT